MLQVEAKKKTCIYFPTIIVPDSDSALVKICNIFVDKDYTFTLHGPLENEVEKKRASEQLKQIQEQNAFTIEKCSLLWH